MDGASEFIFPVIEYYHVFTEMETEKIIHAYLPRVMEELSREVWFSNSGFCTCHPFPPFPVLVRIFLPYCLW